MSVDGWSRILVLGGIRSGKSEFAESLVETAPAVRYVATAAGGADDPEWAARIEAHRARRPETWTTEDANADPSRLAELIADAGPNETLLVDDLGGWVTVLLDPAHQPADDVATIGELATAVRSCAARLVLVSPEVGLSMVPVTPLGRAFSDALGSANRAVADACDAVALVVAGQPCWLKPGAGHPAAVPATPAGAVPAQSAPAVLPSARSASAATDAVSAPVQAASALLPESAPVSGAGTDGTPAVGESGGAPRPRTARPNPPPAGTARGMPEVLRPTVPPAPATVPPSGEAWAAPTMALPVVETGLVIQPGMELPMPDEYAGPAALDRLGTLDLPGAGLGNLAQVVGFAAATQGTEVPATWRTVRVLLLRGDHEGGAAAGTIPGDSARRADRARAGDGPLARLAAEVGATLQVVDAPTAAPMEDGPALSAEAVESALRYGWRLAEEAADSGVQVIVLAGCGAGTEAAAAAVLAATAGAEPAAVLARVIVPGGRVDDEAWMSRCAAVRDALHRTRRGDRGAKEVLAELGGGDIAIATGILLGATARRTPVLLDGPLGVAAGLVSRDLAGQARHWCLLPDHGNHPAVRLGADVLGLTPLLDLRLDLGEGTTALAALPLLRSALTLGAALPVHPALAATDPPDPPAGEPAEYIADPPAPEGAEPPAPEAAEPPAPEGADPGNGGPDDAEFAEPTPTGPGPTAPDDAATAPDDPAAPDDAATAPDDPAAPDDAATAPDDLTAPDDAEFAEPTPTGPGPAAPDDTATAGPPGTDGATVPRGA